MVTNEAYTEGPSSQNQFEQDVFKKSFEDWRAETEPARPVKKEDEG